MLTAYGTPLVEDPNRVGEVRALGLDETRFYCEGRHRNQQWSTSIVDVTSATLLDVVPKGGAEPRQWIANQPKEWRDEVEWGTLDLAASYRSVFREVLSTYRYHGRRSISRHKDPSSQHSPRLEEEEGATRHSWPPRQGRGPPLWRPGTPRHDQGTTEQ